MTTYRINGKSNVVRGTTSRGVKAVVAILTGDVDAPYQDIGGGSQTVLTADAFDSGVAYDPDAFCPDTHSFVVPTGFAGWYEVTATVHVFANVTGVDGDVFSATAGVRVNDDTPTAAGGGAIQATSENPTPVAWNGTGPFWHFVLAGTLYLAVGDLVTLFAGASLFGDLSPDAGDISAAARAFRIAMIGT
jgi:hypothetical protein